ncbi:MAG: metalloregulator ArsR/SmtB family transcription factor [Reinekea sp.]|jgi:DNA-binding transcriptional ArsR family regulator|nr:metalloregulator ArsR/SmtB family transcription factor [Reinekea sp.]
MARKRTTYDPFNAIAEPNRRALLEALAGNSLTVSALALALGWNQPKVSKHLQVLKEVDLVVERKEGRFRVYRVNAQAMKPVQEWVTQFQAFWAPRLDALGDYLNEVQTGEQTDDEPKPR